MFIIVPGETLPDPMAIDSRVSASTEFLRSVFGVPLRLQTYRNLLYLVLAFPLGLAYFIFVSVGVSLGIGLAITVIGIPILLVVLAISTGLARFEREVAAILLGVTIETPESSTPDTLVERAKRLVIDLERGRHWSTSRRSCLSVLSRL
jgi:hypothetical protein